MVLPGLLLFFSAVQIFSSREAVKQKVIPNTYEAALVFVAGQMSADPDEVSVFASRLKTIVVLEDYTAILGAGVDSFSIGDFADLRFDLKSIKAELQNRVPVFIARMPSCEPGESVERFRFCTVAGQEPQAAAWLAAAIEKEFPNEAYLQGDEGQKAIVQQLVRVPSLARFSLALAFLVGFGILAFILRSASRFLAWSAALLLIVAAFGGIISSLVYALPAVFVSTEGVSPDVMMFLQEILRPVMDYFKMLTVTLGVLGVVCIGGFFLLRSRRHESP